METKEYTTIDKSEWPRGRWDDEPDKRQWQDEATGLPCLMVRGPGGHWCGYVGVDATHPLFQKDYSHLYEGDLDIEVHGGLTFSAVCADSADEKEGICHVPSKGEPDHVWWFGFDCAHSGDYSPKSAAYGPDRFGGYDGNDWHSETYKTTDYVAREVRRLAAQLHAAR